MKAKNRGNKDMNRAMQYSREMYACGDCLNPEINGFNKHLFLERKLALKEKLFPSTLIAVIFFCFAAIMSAPCVAQTPTPTETFPKNAAIGAIIGILIAFALLIYVGVRVDKNLDKGELRRAIAGTFVVGFSILAILSFVFDILREHIVTAYIELVGIVIGFYFGQRSAATAAKPETKVEGGT